MPPRRPSLRRAALAVLVAAALLAVAGCGDDQPTTTVGNPPTSSRTASGTSTAPSDSGTPASAGTGSAGTGSTRYPTYVALGDSYTAAPGVPTTEQDDGCLRSDGNYPTLLNAKLTGATFVDVSCSGASVTSLIGVQRSGEHTQEPQFDALKPDTSLVTIGIGGNDLDFFQTVIAGCIQTASSDATGHPCQDYALAHGKHGGDLLLQKVREIGSRVQAALAGIRDRSPNATIVLVGYPQPVPAKGTCRSILPLAAGDYPYVRSVFAALDKDLAGAAAKTEVDYVDMLAASTGHSICAASNAWVNGIATDVERALAFHPFAEEQQVVADKIAQEIGIA